MGQGTPALLRTMDIHSLTLGIDKEGKRYLRKIDDWEEWIQNTDYLQMNETEAILLMKTAKTNLKNSEEFANY